jgi:hypothetical protein
VIVLALTAVPASADIISDPAQGALQMTFVYWPDGSARLKNTHTETMQIDCYEIWSAGNNLDPVGWVSLDDYDDTSDGMIELANALGNEAVGFSEMTYPTSGLLIEVHGGGHATFEPGESWGIGKPVSTPVPDPFAQPCDLTFYYTMPGYVNVKFLGNVVPEPATLALLAIAGLAVVRRRSY